MSHLALERIFNLSGPFLKTISARKWNAGGIRNGRFKWGDIKVIGSRFSLRLLRGENKRMRGENVIVRELTTYSRSIMGATKGSDNVFDWLLAGLVNRGGRSLSTYSDSARSAELSIFHNNAPWWADTPRTAIFCWRTANHQRRDGPLRVSPFAHTYTPSCKLCLRGFRRLVQGDA